jgi:hypothetical protein
MSDGTATPEDSGDLDAQVALHTGIRGQRLLIQGWFASHADSGAPGPHVRLHAGGPMDPVLKTSQIPALIKGLSLVADRIDAQWERDGEDYLQTLVDAPDPNDPAVVRQRKIQDLELHDLIATHWSEVATLVADSENTDGAVERVAALLGVDEVRVLIRLSQFSLFSLTRGARAARARTLEELREQP